MRYGTVSIKIGEDKDRGPVRLYHSRDAGGRQIWLAWGSGQGAIYRDAGNEHISSLVGKALDAYRNRYEQLFQYDSDPLRRASFLAGMLTGMLRVQPEPDDELLWPA